MKQYILTVLALFNLVLTLPACTAREGSQAHGPPAPLDAVPDIAGTYVVNGFDPLGTEYGGHLTITNGDTSDTYLLQWIVTGSVQEGAGTLEGNQLRVRWQTVADAADESEGEAVYTVTVDGVLMGTRTVEGFDEEGTETAFPNE